MCDRLDGVNDLAAAARALSDACLCRIDDVAGVLQRAFGAELARKEPEDLLALLGRLSDPEPPAPRFPSLPDV